MSGQVLGGSKAGKFTSALEVFHTIPTNHAGTTAFSVVRTSKKKKRRIRSVIGVEVQ
jgi:hypothetical protein